MPANYWSSPLTSKEVRKRIIVAPQALKVGFEPRQQDSLFGRHVKINSEFAHFERCRNYRAFSMTGQPLNKTVAPMG